MLLKLIYLFLFTFFFNVATIEFSVLYVARIVFLLDSAALGVALPEVRAEMLDARMAAP